MLRDLRHGIRVLMQAKGWTAVVVLSLAVGIGANAAVFTAVNGLLLRKLAVQDPDSLVRLRWRDGTTWRTIRATTGQPRTLARAGADDVLLSDVPAFPRSQPDDGRSGGSGPVGVTVTIVDGRAETVSALLVTGNYLDARRQRADRPHHRAERRQRLGTAGRGAERALLAIAVRGRSAGHRESHHDRQRAGHHRRSHAGRSPARSASLAEPRDVTMPIALDAEDTRRRPRCTARQTGGCRSWDG